MEVKKRNTSKVVRKAPQKNSRNSNKKALQKTIFMERLIAVVVVLAAVICIALGVYAANRMDDAGEAEVAEVVEVTRTELPPAAVTMQEDSRAVMVLNYHKVTDSHMSLAMPPSDFEQQMAWLQEYGYTSITPDQLYDFIKDGAELPEKPVIITFDDGYRDNYTNAYPIMKKYGFTGTIFLVTGFPGVYDDYLTWEQVKELSNNGFSIQSHTHTHMVMTDASDEEITQELTKSRDMLTEKLGITPGFMAYPTGTYNLHIADLVKKAGYKGAFTIKYDNISRESNVYALERVPMFHTQHSNADFLERIQYIPLLYRYAWVKK